MMRFKRFSGRACENCDIPYVSELTVKEAREINNYIAKKIEILEILCPLNDDIKKFIEDKKPNFLKIKEGKLDDNKDIKVVYSVENEEITFK